MAGDVEAGLVDARPVIDPAAIAAARTRIAGALFGGAATGLGRFRILERLGAGGMGVVYAAYDPELDRGVALKLVRVPARGRDAALAEAKALARLAHPNVVPVHDAGIVGDRVYIVMELVRGAPLRRWCQGKRRHDIVRAYAQVGEGLAAAHAAGLVHRDVKPDNAIVGSDGRVRVVDFGLACEASASPAEGDGPQVVAGTPRYMAPEQAAGAPVTPAADQYSFCVALAEALAQAGPLPRWLEAALARGRAADPAARFPSMHELVRALTRDPARMLRTRVAAVALVVVGGGAFVVGRASPEGAGQVEPCTGADAALAAAWPPGEQRAAVARIAGLGPYGAALAPRLEAQLRAHAASWTTGHRDACLAHRRGAQSAALLDRRMACLERGRAALGAVRDIVTAVDAGGLTEAALASSSLPAPAACGDLDALLAEVPPPPPEIAGKAAEVSAAVERVRVELAAGRVSGAQAPAAAAVAAARALGYRPLLAEALVVEGRARMIRTDRLLAVPALAEATAVALEVGDDGLAVEAWARRIWVESTVGSAPGAALASQPVFEALAARTPSAGAARALLHNNLGGAALARGDRAAARAAFERALVDARRVAGPDALELVMVRANLALVTDDAARRDALFAEADRALVELVGDDHPQTLTQRGMRAMMAVDPGAALAGLAPVCARYERLHPALIANALACWIEVGLLADDAGDRPRAVDAMTHAAVLRARAGGGSVLAPGYLALWRGDPRTAAAQVTAALATLPPPGRAAWWDELERARLELALGEAHLAAGARGAARAVLRRALDRLDGVKRSQPAPAVERLAARARRVHTGL
jgi:eukaryotic-like serine/threonine-protein kinase